MAYIYRPCVRLVCTGWASYSISSTSRIVTFGGAEAAHLSHTRIIKPCYTRCTGASPSGRKMSYWAWYSRTSTRTIESGGTLLTGRTSLCTCCSWTTWCTATSPSGRICSWGTCCTRGCSWSAIPSCSTYCITLRCTNRRCLSRWTWCTGSSSRGC